jgi:hypothetical protein
MLMLGQKTVLHVGPLNSARMVMFNYEFTSYFSDTLDGDRTRLFIVWRTTL